MSNFLNNDVVRRYLVRALAGDSSERPRPPVTLAGRQHGNGSAAASPSAASPAPAPPVWTGDLRRSRIVTGAAEAEPGDEQWTYSREELIRMDRRFRARLLHAFERGKESRQAAANQIAAPRW
jgi:hypothetical protein